MAANATQRTVIIIGAGIAGLSTGVYAQRNGYRSKIYEMHDIPGGLMTAWKRKGYMIDGCIHWLVGSSPKSSYYELLEQVGMIQGRKIYDPDVFMVYEGKGGQTFTMYSNIDRLEQHMLELAPEDEKLIREMCAASRSMVGFNPPANSGGSFIKNVFGTLRTLPTLIQVMPKLQKWGGMTIGQMAARFKNPFLRECFENLWMPEMSAGALVFTLAFMHDQTAGYPIGGSLPMARAVEKRYCDLGGEIYYGSRVEKILTEPRPDGKGDRVVGIRLADGTEERADYVVSAADGHATLWNMLEGRYLNGKIRQIYQGYKLFPPILLVGLGVNRKFDDLPGATGGYKIAIDEPIRVGSEDVRYLDLMIYNFDPSLAPQGKTAVTAMIPTTYQYWKDLSEDAERYSAEKERIGLEVMQRLDRRFPGFAGQVEMADVATPMTFERFTGNWQASFEGFLPTPQTMTKAIPKELPGLSNFYMAGQWVQAGGGVPTGVTTGREAIKMICKQDGVTFK